MIGQVVERSEAHRAEDLTEVDDATVQEKGEGEEMFFPDDITLQVFPLLCKISSSSTSIGVSKHR